MNCLVYLSLQSEMIMGKIFNFSLSFSIVSIISSLGEFSRIINIVGTGSVALFAIEKN